MASFKLAVQTSFFPSFTENLLKRDGVIHVAKKLCKNAVNLTTSNYVKNNLKSFQFKYFFKILNFPARIVKDIFVQISIGYRKRLWKKKKMCRSLFTLHCGDDMTDG